MSEVRLTLRAAPSVPLEASCVRPDAFAALSNTEIAQLPVEHGRERARLGDFFDVRGERSDQLRIEGDVRRAKRLGAGMSGGNLVIAGSAGRHTGAGMSGGRLVVEGDADEWTGLGMRGGILEVGGDAAAGFCGAAPGSSRGMTGGLATVRGSVGARAGERLRRGVIAVAGSAGPYAGAHMVAGTLVVRGALGPGAGVGLKRGTIVAGGALELLPTFRYACTYRPGFVDLLLLSLKRHGFDAGPLGGGTFARHVGDCADLGRGEILQWTAL